MGQYRWRKRKRPWAAYFLEGLSGLLVITGVGGGLGLLGWQLLSYLHSGAWNAVSVLTVLEWLGIASAFIPADWYKALAFIPLSITLLIIGVVVGYMLLSLADHVRPKDVV